MRAMILVVVGFLFPFCLVAEEEKVVNDPRFHKTLLEIAGCYERFGRVDDAMRWAPWLCIAPGPSQPRVSAAKSEKTHGGKLYFLFTNQRTQYVKETESDVWNDYAKTAFSPVIDSKMSNEERNKTEAAWRSKFGKNEAEPSADVLAKYVIVKESWMPKKWNGELITTVGKIAALTEADKKQIDGDKHADARMSENSLDHVVPFVEKDGENYVLGERAPIFIMYRTEKETPGTDEGWVYGTVTADAKTVTSSGRVASCMGCHTEAPYPKEPKGAGRLFGLPEKVKKKEN